MLKVEDLHVSYGNIRVLRGVSIEINEGEMVTVLGANGAGKSTLLKAISRLLPIAHGSIRFKNVRIDKLPPHQIVKQGILQIPEGRGILPTMSVQDNLLLGAYLRKDDRTRVNLKNNFDRFPILGERRNQLAGSLSGGEQQILAIARALMAEPILLIMDEPSIGLAPLMVKELFSVIHELKESGATILLVEQNARAALMEADRGYVLENGKVVLSGTASSLAADGRIVAAYLGKDGS
ncbi:MAG: ABC transporter ATP-binding protein [Pseudomonadota bacterium]